MRSDRTARFNPRRLLPALLAAAAGCATLQKTPLIGRLFVPAPRYGPYLKNPHFYAEYPLAWGEPVELKNGVEFRSPDHRAVIAALYVPPGDPDYQPPERYRRSMASRGAVEDTHRVAQVFLSTVPASGVQYTTYEYDPEHLLGEKVLVRYTELRMTPYLGGLILVRYSADKDVFEERRYRKHFDHFLQTLLLSVPPAKEEQ